MIHIYLLLDLKNVSLYTLKADDIIYIIEAVVAQRVTVSTIVVVSITSREIVNM